MGCNALLPQIWKQNLLHFCLGATEPVSYAVLRLVQRFHIPAISPFSKLFYIITK